MSRLFLKFNNVSFGYENSPVDIFSGISFQIDSGWTGVIGPNGSGKTTLLKLAGNLLKCSSGVIESPGSFYYNEQRTDDMPAVFRDFLKSYDKLSFHLMEKLNIEPEWLNRWETLSHGERKRAQIACALWKSPGLLAVDEPTNHLNHAARQMIIDSLKSFRGIGLIVSHDRELMENLCMKFLFVDPPSVDFRLGRLSDVRKQIKAENDFALNRLALKKMEVDKLENEYRRRSAVVEKSKAKSSKRNIDRKDRDAKAKIDLGRLTGKDAVGGKQKTIMHGRIQTAKNELNDIEVKREYRTGIVLSDSVSKRNYLLNLEAGSLKLSDDKELRFKNIVIGATDKISITGDNGSGKSSFIKHILNHINAGIENITYIPQEISVDETTRLITEIKKLPNDQLGRLMIAVSRLGSDAGRVLASGIPSPGETRKLLLGLGISKNPHIIIMDEPTNHMDLVSVECLEDALKSVSCALLLVSHDRKFIEAVTSSEWRIEGNGLIYSLNNS